VVGTELKLQDTNLKQPQQKWERRACAIRKHMICSTTPWNLLVHNEGKKTAGNEEEITRTRKKDKEKWTKKNWKEKKDQKKKKMAEYRIELCVTRKLYGEGGVGCYVRRERRRVQVMLDIS
jgi:hypothetical protein